MAKSKYQYLFIFFLIYLCIFRENLCFLGFFTFLSLKNTILKLSCSIYIKISLKLFNIEKSFDTKSIFNDCGR